MKIKVSNNKDFLKQEEQSLLDEGSYNPTLGVESLEMQVSYSDSAEVDSLSQIDLLEFNPDNTVEPKVSFNNPAAPVETNKTNTLPTVEVENCFFCKVIDFPIVYFPQETPVTTDTNTGDTSVNHAPVLDGNTPDFQEFVNTKGVPFFFESNYDNSVESILNTQINPNMISLDGSLVPNSSEQRVTDVDADAQQGIAIVDTSFFTNLMYSTDNGETWNEVGEVSETNALLLRESDLIKNDVHDYGGFCGYGTFSAMSHGGTFKFRAWDQTDGNEAGTKVDVTDNGGSTAYSEHASYAAAKTEVTYHEPNLSVDIDDKIALELTPLDVTILPFDPVICPAPYPNTDLETDYSFEPTLEPYPEPTGVDANIILCDPVICPAPVDYAGFDEIIDLEQINSKEPVTATTPASEVCPDGGCLNQSVMDFICELPKVEPYNNSPDILFTDITGANMDQPEASFDEALGNLMKDDILF